MRKLLMAIVLCLVCTLGFCNNSNDTTYYDSFGNLVIEEYCEVCECTIRQVYYEYPQLNSTSLFSMPWYDGENCSDYNDCIYFEGGYIRTTCVHKRKEC